MLRILSPFTYDVVNLNKYEVEVFEINKGILGKLWYVLKGGNK